MSANGKERRLMGETTPNNSASLQSWPWLRVDEWIASRDTLHMRTQIVGKTRLAHAPMVNHWWQVTLYVSPRGLTTSAIPYEAGVFELEFDFIEHRLHIRSIDGGARRIALEPKAVADFFWGALDLACTRFSGRTAPKHQGGAPNCGNRVMVEGYSHELSSRGFWPVGGDGVSQHHLSGGR